MECDKSSFNPHNLRNCALLREPLNHGKKSTKLQQLHRTLKTFRVLRLRTYLFAQNEIINHSYLPLQRHTIQLPLEARSVNVNPLLRRNAPWKLAADVSDRDNKKKRRLEDGETRT